MVDEIDFTILERIKKREREKAERARKLGEETSQGMGEAVGGAGGKQAQMQSLFSIFDAPLATQEQAQVAQQTQQIQAQSPQTFSQDLVFQKLLEIYEKISKMEEVLNGLKQKIDGKE